MLPPKLFRYLEEKKKAGYPDEMIRQQFLQQGWPAEVLDEAYAKLNVKSAAMSAQQAQFDDTAALTHLAAQPSSTTINATPTPVAALAPKKALIPKKWPFFLFLLFVLLGNFYEGIGVQVMTFLVGVQNAIYGSGQLGSAIASYPTVFAIVCLGMLASLFGFYLALKSRYFSPQSWKISVTSAICLPLLFYPIVDLLWLPLYRKAAAYGNPISFFLPNWDLLIISLILLILWHTRSLHQNQNRGLTKIAKFWVILVFVVTVASVVVAGFVLGKTQDGGDFGYQKISQTVSYKIYKPDPLPDNFVYGSAYTMRKATTGEVFAGVTFSNQTGFQNAAKDAVISLSQEPIPSNFDIQTDFSGYDPAQTIALPLAASQSAMISSKAFGTSVMANLEFLSRDQTLVRIIGVNASKQMLIDFAQSLQ